MVKISSYLVSNAKQELHYYGLDLIEKEIQSIFQDFVVFSKVEEESTSDNLDDLNEIMNYSEPDIEHQNLEIENLIVLNNFKLDEEGKILNKELNEEELNREELDHEELDHEKFDESKFSAEFELMLSSI
ncbi:hypothetical protein F8M41_005189 [Gigaspora margarita]|uniref:Uncharacterized protein n=1 Tax=Gigaspora margarita TaxID=4874 RepID=A0A8H4ERS3_GIGMA|nr:hypothetical protein F8M41_005189 [Gigaspora margarita]